MSEWKWLNWLHWDSHGLAVDSIDDEGLALVITSKKGDDFKLFLVFI